MVALIYLVMLNHILNNTLRELNFINKKVFLLNLFYREVVECEEFLTLSQQQVSKLICSDRLTVPSEEKVL